MYQRILVPIDGTAISNRGLDAAIETARLTGASIRLLHVIDELVFATGFETGTTYLQDVLPRIRSEGARILDEARARITAAGVAVDTVLSECFGRRTADVVLEAAKDWPADLIVIGTHGRRGIGRLLLGSDAEQILRGAQVPVLLVRAVQQPATSARAAVAIAAEVLAHASA